MLIEKSSRYGSVWLTTGFPAPDSDVSREIPKLMDLWCCCEVDVWQTLENAGNFSGVLQYFRSKG